MKPVTVFFLVGLAVLFTSASTVAIPLDINFTGSAPSQYWGGSAFNDPGFLDSVSIVNDVPSINLAGVNSITLTWAAPAGYMYVITPPPPGVGGGLFFETGYGLPGQASSLGSITRSSFSISTVYGASLVSGFASLDDLDAGLDFYASGGAPLNSAPFAFTSVTISADFSGTGADTTLDRMETPQAYYFPINFMAIFTGDFPVTGPGLTYSPVPDPGPLMTLEPVPSGSAPDVSSTLSLAGLGFAGLLLMGRRGKRLPV